MDKEKAALELRALAASDQRTEIAKLREIVDDIEAAIAAGVTRKQVYEVVKKRGINLTFRGFEQALYRIRQARATGRTVKQYAVPESQVQEASPDEGFGEAVNSTNRQSKLKSYLKKPI
jgi:hypothetical protein